MQIHTGDNTLYKCSLHTGVIRLTHVTNLLELQDSNSNIFIHVFSSNIPERCRYTYWREDFIKAINTYWRTIEYYRKCETISMQ